MNSFYRWGFSVGFLVGIWAASVQAQTEGADNEIKRLQGHWRITEMTDDGRVVTEYEMRQSLPGGGLVEIIDNTLLFKSPVDGTKSTKSIRLDAASYPKKIAIIDKEMVTGVGIYEFDRGRFVICVASPEASLPTELSAPQGSKRTLMVLEAFDPGKTDFQLDLTPRQHVPQIPVSQASVQKQTDLQKLAPPPQPAQPQAQPAQPQIIIQQAPPPAQIVVKETIVQASPAAGRILTDAEVRAMLVGNWQMKDGEGLVDVRFFVNGTFQTYRRSEVMSNFHTTFVPTPVSAGNWSVTNGQLDMRVTSSWRADKVNMLASMAVRSISATDAILVDYLGRTSRAIKTQ